MVQGLSSYHSEAVRAWQDQGEVDRQHARIFALVGEFNAAVRAEADVSHLAIVLEEIIERTRDHARSEEARLLAAGHAGYHAHCAMHRQIIDELGEFRRALAADEFLSAADNLHILDRLLIHHLRDERDHPAH